MSKINDYESELFNLLKESVHHERLEIIPALDKATGRIRATLVIVCPDQLLPIGHLISSCEEMRQYADPFGSATHEGNATCH